MDEVNVLVNPVSDLPPLGSQAHPLREVPDHFNAITHSIRELQKRTRSHDYLTYTPAAQARAEISALLRPLLAEFHPDRPPRLRSRSQRAYTGVRLLQRLRELGLRVPSHCAPQIKATLIDDLLSNSPPSHRNRQLAIAELVHPLHTPRLQCTAAETAIVAPAALVQFIRVAESRIPGQRAAVAHAGSNYTGLTTQYHLLQALLAALEKNHFNCELPVAQALGENAVQYATAQRFVDDAGTAPQRRELIRTLLEPTFRKTLGIDRTRATRLAQRALADFQALHPTDLATAPARGELLLNLLKAAHSGTYSSNERLRDAVRGGSFVFAIGVGPGHGQLTIDQRRPILEALVDPTIILRLAVGGEHLRDLGQSLHEALESLPSDQISPDVASSRLKLLKGLLLAMAFGGHHGSESQMAAFRTTLRDFTLHPNRTRQERLALLQGATAAALIDVDTVTRFDIYEMRAALAAELATPDAPDLHEAQWAAEPALKAARALFHKDDDLAQGRINALRVHFEHQRDKSDALAISRTFTIDPDLMAALKIATVPSEQTAVPLAEAQKITTTMKAIIGSPLVHSYNKAWAHLELARMQDGRLGKTHRETALAHLAQVVQFTANPEPLYTALMRYFCDDLQLDCNRKSDRARITKLLTRADNFTRLHPETFQIGVATFTKLRRLSDSSASETARLAPLFELLRPVMQAKLAQPLTHQGLTAADHAALTAALA